MNLLHRFWLLCLVPLVVPMAFLPIKWLALMVVVGLGALLWRKAGVWLCVMLACGLTIPVQALPPLTPVAAVPTMDLTVPPGYLLLQNTKHIKGTSSYYCFLMVALDGSIATSLYLYNTAGQHSIVSLGTNTEFALGSTATEFEFVGNHIILLGTGAIPIQHNYYEYVLGSQSPLPTTATLVTNFSFGTSGIYGQPVLTALSNGGLAMAMAEQCVGVDFLYRFPSGLITNYGPKTIVGGNINCFPLLGGAENPADHSWWIFLDKDAYGIISASQFVTRSNGNEGLYLSTSYQMVNSAFDPELNDYVWGLESCYGEYAFPEYISDTVSNRLLGCYCNDYYHDRDRDASNVGDRVTFMSAVGFVGATNNHYALGVSSNNVHRFATGGITQVGNTITLAYQQSFDDGSADTNGYPFWIQNFTDGGTPSVPMLFTNSTLLYSFFPYAAHRKDYVVQYTNNSIHLLSFEQATAPTRIAQVKNFHVAKTVLGP